MKLSEQLKKARADRPDEWVMDRYIKLAVEMENELEIRGGLISENLEVKRCPCGKLCKIGYVCTCGKEID